MEFFPVEEQEAVLRRQNSVSRARHARREGSAERFHRLAGTRGTPAARAGEVPAALGKASKTIEAEYHVPYLAHAMMEPPNCTVRIGPDKCEIWTGTQFQTLDQQPD